MNQLALDFYPKTTSREFLTPAGYSGLYGFHKYWGKKPPETISFLVESLSSPDDLVFDPFVGSGAAARETYIRERRFIGCDINPTAIELAQLYLLPPSCNAVATAFQEISQKIQNKIEQQYRLQDGSTASHFLWNDSTLQSVWRKSQGKRSRIELSPTNHDIIISDSFETYQLKHLRPYPSSNEAFQVIMPRAKCNMAI